MKFVVPLKIWVFEAGIEGIPLSMPLWPEPCFFVQYDELPLPFFGYLLISCNILTRISDILKSVH
jgi:hypothetical protein